ncbi:MAG: hypothetical protein GY754_14840 [bacterium]|nr:hypothetical protein [bacterium]
MNGIISIVTKEGKDLNGSMEFGTRIGNKGIRIFDFLTGGSGQYMAR